VPPPLRRRRPPTQRRQFSAHRPHLETARRAQAPPPGGGPAAAAAAVHAGEAGTSLAGARPAGFRAPPPPPYAAAAAAAACPADDPAGRRRPSPPGTSAADAVSAGALGAATARDAGPLAGDRPSRHTWADVVAARRMAPLVAAAGGSIPKNENRRPAMDTRAAAVAAARTTRAAAAAATLRRLAARSETWVTLRTVYVRGVAGESRTWRLRDILAAVTRLPRRAVVHASRCSDLIEVRVLAEHADAFEAAVALSPEARDLTLVSGVDPLSVSLLGSRRRRGLTGEQAREKARDCHVARCREQLGSVDGRVGMPAAHRAALSAALTRELAPFVRVLGAGGAEATSAARRGADRGDPVLAAARGAAVDVGGNRRGDETPSPTASTTAAASAGVPEFS